MNRRTEEKALWGIVTVSTLLCVLFLASCSTNMIRVDAIDGPVQRMTKRHDEYVRADDDLSSAVKEIYLLSSELLNRVIEEAKK